MNTTTSNNIVTIKNDGATPSSSALLSKEDFHRMILEISGGFNDKVYVQTSNI